MKKIHILLLFIATMTYSQEIATVTLENLDGSPFNTNSFSIKNDQPIVLSFWATWCIPCLNELATFNDNYADWKQKYQFDFYAISVDDDRTAKKVQPMVNGKNWDFNVLLDTNQDFKRSLNVTNIPQIFVIKNGKIIYKKTGYAKGDELSLEKIIAANQ